MPVNSDNKRLIYDGRKREEKSFSSCHNLIVILIIRIFF